MLAEGERPRAWRAWRPLLVVRAVVDRQAVEEGPMTDREYVLYLFAVVLGALAVGFAIGLWTLAPR